MDKGLSFENAVLTVNREKNETEKYHIYGSI